MSSPHVFSGNPRNWIPNYFWLIARVFAGLVFFYAGFSKLTEPIENFRGVIAEYQLFPYALIPGISLVLPWIEFIFGAFMILGFAPKLSSLVLGSLSLGFMIVLGVSFLRGTTPASCGCFGQGGIHLTPLQTFILDLVDFIICLRIFRLKKHPLSLDNSLV